jgi:hypothetical protein
MTPHHHFKILKAALSNPIWEMPQEEGTDVATVSVATVNRKPSPTTHIYCFFVYWLPTHMLLVYSLDPLVGKG